MGKGGVYRMERVAAGPDPPLLRSVPRAYILTMTTSTRLAKPTARALTRLCGETIVQWNPGWRAGGKPPHVDSSAKDILHAYRNVCQHCADLQAPVLILEDDAQLMDGATPRDFEAVDAFLRADARPWDVYSLGSLGVFDRLQDVGPHRKFLASMSFAQAVVWSPAARAAFLRRDDDDPRLTHIDGHVLSAFRHKYAYRRPLVVQLFPTSENMRTWCRECKGRAWERSLIKAGTVVLQGVLRLHRDPKGWHVLSSVNHSIQPACAAVGLCVVAYALRALQRE